jgi:hypothetical protein
MWSRPLLASKARAFLIHVAVSAAIFAAVILVVLTLWFPEPYFRIDGGLAMIALAAAVDLVVGPLITFLVYRPMRRDNYINFAVIAFLQSAALTWGVHILYSQRPLYAAYVGGPVGAFFPVTGAFIEAAPPSEELRAQLNGHPPLVFIPLSSDPERARGMLLSAQLGGPSLLASTHLWRPIDGRALGTIVHEARSRAALEALDPDTGRLLDEFLAARGTRFEDFAFVPLRGRYQSALLALRKTDGVVAGIVYANVRPE